MDINNAKPPEVPTQKMIIVMQEDLIQRKEVITDRINLAEGRS